MIDIYVFDKSNIFNIKRAQIDSGSTNTYVCDNFKTRNTLRTSIETKSVETFVKDLTNPNL